MGVTLAELDADPHPALARLRAQAPVSWVDALGGWLVTGYAAAAEVLADPVSFTVDDPRFTTARVTGPSMLSLDGAQHARHRAPFVGGFRHGVVADRLGPHVQAEAVRLVSAIRPAGTAELRESVAGPLAASVMAQALGLSAAGVPAGTVLAWYRDIVAAVAELPASGTGQQATVRVASFTELAGRLRSAIRFGQAPLLAEAARDGTLSDDEVISNAAVALFGGIETTEGMICNAVLHVLGDPGLPGLIARDRALASRAVEESLRLEPAAAVVDRYATRPARLRGAAIRPGDLVRVSISGANRDPAVFASPDRFDVQRANASRHLAFARGPHFCIGAHLARLEAVTALAALASGLAGLRLDPAAPPPAVRGVVFRKPAALRVRWG